MIKLEYIIGYLNTKMRELQASQKEFEIKKQRQRDYREV